jgi:putative nucleotidyltransferase with HDIG domain
MISILFVDDEPAVLEGLENRLRRLRKQWDLHFALGASEALRKMDERPIDVIVSDMRMPGIDGTELLERVRQRHPKTVRFVLSGQTSEDNALRAMPLAHQFLTKPCDATALEAAVDRICTLQRHMDRPAVQQALGLLGSLPVLPRLYWDLVKEIENTHSSAASVAAIIEQDVAMTARLLQLANSAFFGSGRHVRNVRDAVALLGLLPIRSVMLSLQVFRTVGERGAANPALEAIQNHSLRVAQLAGSMVRDPEERKNAFSAGVLHDIGHLAVAVGMPERFAELRQQAAASRRPLHQLETELLGCNHAELGAQMLSVWGLPVSIVEAVAYHHEPALSKDQRFSVTAAVHVASVLAGSAAGAAVAALDFGYLERIGMGQTVQGWLCGETIVAQ